MGWMYCDKPRNVKEFLDNDLTWSDETTSVRVLASAIVNMNVHYAAVEVISNGVRHVTANITLIRYTKDSGRYPQIGVKSMSEDCGPYNARCPEKILALLTETTSEYAIGWRQACYKYHEGRNKLKALKDGDVINFACAIRFSDGRVFDRMAIKRIDSKLFVTPVGENRLYKLTRDRLARELTAEMVSVKVA